MPRFSFRYYHLKEMAEALEERDEFRFLRESDVLSEDSFEDDMDLVDHAEHEEALSRRYLFRSPKYRNGKGNDALTFELDEKK
jgi:hypothetical protein